MKYIVSEMVCDNAHNLHQMKAPKVFNTEFSAREYVVYRIDTAYSKEKGYKFEDIRRWKNEICDDIVTLYYKGGFTEFYVNALEL